MTATGKPKGHIARQMLMENPNANMNEIARIVGLSNSRIHQIRNKMQREERQRAEIEHDKATLTIDNEAWRYVRAHGASLRVQFCMRIMAPVTARKVRSMSDMELLRMPYFGTKCLPILRAIIGYDDSQPMLPDDDMPTSEWLCLVEIGIRAHNVALKIAGNGTVGDLRREIERPHRGLGPVTIDELRAALYR